MPVRVQPLTPQEDRSTMTGENAGASNGQAPNDTQPPEGIAGTSQDDGAQNGQAPGAQSGSGTGDDRQISELRRENQTLRKRLRETTDSDESTALRTRVTELETRLQDRDVAMTAMAAAGRKNFRNPELAYRLIDRGRVEFAKDGSPKNIDVLLDEVLKDNPYLAATSGDFGGGDRGQQPASNDMNALLRAGRS